MDRGSGILLPIFSLSSKYGIGTFGKEGHSFVLFLEKAKQKYWQLLPLNPTSYGDSPYQSFSAFALNPYFIDLNELCKDGYLDKADLKGLSKGYETKIDYGRLYVERFGVLKVAYQRAMESGLRSKLEEFIVNEKDWLVDYAVFMVIKGLNDGKSWQEWDREYKFYSAELLEKIKEEESVEYFFWVFLQYLAQKQYSRLKRYANKHSIKIIGDIPIYVALDSADVWANAELFQLDANLTPTKVAGVPPDYFSATGQLWGNPLYDYDRLEKTNYAWWQKRIKKCAELYDILRIDHFRGIADYWAIPYGEATAINGKWIIGPGIKLVNALIDAAPSMQFIAEDLGLVTPDVVELKNQASWPGMKIYQFAFDGDYNNAFLPHNYERNCVAYTGTHDNDTLASFIETNPQQHEFMKRYLNVLEVEDIHETMIGTMMRSQADTVILCLQDILKEKSRGRINLPGTVGNNWDYRLPKDSLTNELASHLAQMVLESDR